MRAAVYIDAQYANSPDVHIYDIDVPPIFAVYHRDEAAGLYWARNDDGFYDFLYNDSSLQEQRPGVWRAKTRSEGFGGRDIRLFVADYSEVTLLGGWSGGCYCANKHLPEPCVEVFFPELGGVANLTIAKANELLAVADWRVIETTGPHAHNTGYWVEAVHRNVKKRDMPRELIVQLQAEYDALGLARRSVYCAR